MLAEMTQPLPTAQPPPSPPIPRMPSPALLREVLGKELLLVTGKGGVGKSTTAQVLARRAASQGKRVLLLELEAVSRAGPLFHAGTVGPQPREVAPGLWLAALETMDSLRYFAVQQLKIETLVNLALRNRAVEGFFQAVPAVKPMLFLYHVWRILEEHGPRGDRRWDLLICDMPTSGFVQGMYQIPLTLQQTFRSGPVHGYGKAMGDLLLDGQRTGLVLVTLPEEMPVVETLELAGALRKTHGVQPVAVVVNGVFPAALDAGELAELATAVQRPTPDAAAVEDALALERLMGAEPVADLMDLGAHLWAAELLLGRRLRAQGLMPKLNDAVHGRILELPFLFRRELPLALIDQLASNLDGGPA